MYAVACRPSIDRMPRSRYTLIFAFSKAIGVLYLRDIVNNLRGCSYLRHKFLFELILRYFLSGTLSTVINYSIFIFCIQLKIYYILAATIAMCATICVGY